MAIATKKDSDNALNLMLRNVSGRLVGVSDEVGCFVFCRLQQPKVNATAELYIHVPIAHRLQGLVCFPLARCV